MNLISEQTWQIIAWLVALIEFSVGLYILLLNVWHTANRHVSALLILIATSTVSTGILMTASTPDEARPAIIIQSMVVPATQIGLLIITAVLLAPQTMQGRRQWLWWLVYGLAGLPAVLTIVDLLTGSQWWFTGIQPGTPVDIRLELGDYTAGRIAVPLRILNSALSTLGIVLALYVALFNRKISRQTRWLAWLVSVGLAAGAGVQLGLREPLTAIGASLVASTTFAALYGFTGFQQMISERRLQKGRLQTRLTTLILAITAPLLIAVVVFVTDRAGRQLQADAKDRLSATHAAVETSTDIWLDLNLKSLEQLVNQPDIISMEPAQQKSVLVAMATTYRHMYLVSTTDLKGINVARNDSAALTNYSDRLWFQGARDGMTFSFQAVIGRTNNKPALVVGLPIRDKSGKTVGVGMFATELLKLSDNVQAVKFGKTGTIYIVDALNWLVAHSDPTQLTTDKNELRSTSEWIPVKLVREGRQATNKIFPYTDNNGVRWQATVGKTKYDWLIVVEQQEAEVLSSLRAFQWIAWGALGVGVALLLVMAWLTFRQAFQPINSLTDTVGAITAGDLTRTAPVESEDEIGTLARAFNSMTGQLRELIGGLEQRVAERTGELEKRSRYLEAAAQVGRAAASILDSEQLIRQVVELIREQFDLYYVGLFLVDEAGQWAVLRAGTGAAGQAMLARGHRLPVNEHSMIGWSVTHGQARIALEAGADAVRLATTELPDTRSEAALPLRTRGRIIGALTVQSAQPNAFDSDTIVVLQTMAEQVAVALDNARLFAESESALEATRRASAQLSREGWAQLLRARTTTGYLSTEQDLREAGDIWRPEMEQARQQGRTIQPDGAGERSRRSLAVPIKVRGSVIGVLDTYRPGEGREWSADEIAALETLADQLGIALESARLYQDTQRRATQERLIGEVTSRMRATLDMETVLETALEEIHRAMGLDEVTIHLATDETRAEPAGNGRE